jgi:hypothetical protein
MKMSEIEHRLDYLRGEIEAERISMGELAELQDLASFIDPGDTTLLEWAGVPENQGPPMNHDQAIELLTKDGDLRVPASRYGTCSSECAEVAWRVAQIVAEATGEPITAESLDGDMYMVVNDSDSVAELLAEYGTDDERKEWAEYAGTTD